MMIEAEIRDDGGELMAVDRFPFIVARSNCQSLSGNNCFEARSRAGERPRTDTMPTSSRITISSSRCMIKDARKDQENAITNAMMYKIR